MIFNHYQSSEPKYKNVHGRATYLYSLCVSLWVELRESRRLTVVVTVTFVFCAGALAGGGIFFLSDSSKLSSLSNESCSFPIIGLQATSNLRSVSLRL